MKGYDEEVQWQACPKIKKRVDKLVEDSRECILHLSRGPKWQVDCSYGTYVVDLEERTCACRKWELTGIPFIHAMAMIRACRNDPEDFVDNCYSVDSYLRCYNNILNPINGRMLWPPVDGETIVPPLWKKTTKGKRQMKRKKQADEMTVYSEGKSYVRKKGQVRMTCSFCQLRRHNKRYHDKKDAPNNDWFEGDIEPIDVRSSLDVTLKGKLAPARKRRPSLNHASTTGENTVLTMDAMVDVRENVTLEDMIADFQQLSESESSQLRTARAEARRSSMITSTTAKRHV